MKLTAERRKDTNKNDPKYEILNVVDDMHILTTSEELLKCLSEGLIDELVIITTTRSSQKGKTPDGNPFKISESRKNRLTKNFLKFSQCRLEIIEVERINGQNRPHRWE